MIKKNINLVLIIIIGLLLLFQFFSYQNKLSQKFDLHYLRDLYDHSQWSIPTSIRPIGDAELYQVAGYELVKNNSFYKINPEVPPLGKYLYGLSIVSFNNPYITSLILWILTIGMFFLVTRTFFQNTFLTLISLLLFVSEPLLISESMTTMLDIPQLLVLLVHIYAILKLVERRKQTLKFYLFTVLAGITLGAFISIKIALFSPIIILVDTIFLWKNRKILAVIPIIAVSGTAYILSYLPYFLAGNTFVDFIRAQKWMLNFYLTSTAKPIPGMVILSLVSGWIKGWNNDSVWMRIPEWTILRLIYLLTLVTAAYRLVRNGLNGDNKFTYLIYLSLGLLAAYSFVPFFHRYLVLVIPLFILLFTQEVIKHKKIPIVIIFTIFAIQFFLFYNPSPAESIKRMTYTWQNGTYQDLYSYLDQKTQVQTKQYEFWEKLALLERDLGVTKKTVSITIPRYNPLQSTVEGKASITYHTKIGLINHSTPVTLSKKGTSWKIDWNMNGILPGFDVNDKIISHYQEGHYGNLALKDGTILITEENRPFFSVIPKNIRNESILVSQLAFLTGLQKHEVEHFYKANAVPDSIIDIGILKPELSRNYISTIDLDKDILVTYKKGKFYNASFQTKEAVQRLRYNDILYSHRINPMLGGKLEIMKQDGRRQVLLERNKVDGENVVIDELAVQK